MVCACVWTILGCLSSLGDIALIAAEISEVIFAEHVAIAISMVIDHVGFDFFILKAGVLVLFYYSINTHNIHID